MHHFSTVRDHALKADALTDYTTSVESLTKVLGTPLRSSMPLPESKLDAALVWFSSVWSFDELEVQLSLLRMGGDGPLSVRERWYQPEAAAARASRGLSPHGGPVRSASNPHIAGTK